MIVIQEEEEHEQTEEEYIQGEAEGDAQLAWELFEVIIWIHFISFHFTKLYLTLWKITAIDRFILLFNRFDSSIFTFLQPGLPFHLWEKPRPWHRYTT